MLRISVALYLLLILFGCLKKETEVKLYKTTIHPYGLQMFTDVDSYRHEVILEIPFKSKVEMVDKKKYYIPDNKIVSSEYNKVKYKETIGYVLSEYLSDRDDLPFVDNIKYNYKLNEFEYNRNSVIKAVIDCTHDSRFFQKDESQYYYIESPQIFTLYAKDCDDSKYKMIAAVLISKLTPSFNEIICFYFEGNKLYPFFGLRFNNQAIEKTLESIRKPMCCGEECD